MEMSTTSYTAPVDKLLTYGKPEPVSYEDWPNYLELGFGPENIPDLLRMVTDRELLKIEEERPEGWAPIHATRVLGQLRDISAVEPLLSKTEAMLDYESGTGEWALEELPEVFGLIGPAAIPALTAYLADKSHEVYARSVAAHALENIATLHPETRSECVTALSQYLESAPEDDSELNAFVISHLAHLKALEALPIIERAFATDSVDTFIIDLDDVLVELGLKERSELPQPNFSLEQFFGKNTQPTTEEDFKPISATPPKPLKGPQPPLKFSGSHKKAKKRKKK